jgi:hypothetical protein
MSGTRRTSIVWLALSVLTLASWLLRVVHDRGALSASTAATIGVLAVALIKGRLIIREFMEVRSAPRWLGWATDGWLSVLWATILVMYLV